MCALLRFMEGIRSFVESVDIESLSTLSRPALTPAASSSLCWSRASQSMPTSAAILGRNRVLPQMEKKKNKKKTFSSR